MCVLGQKQLKVGGFVSERLKMVESGQGWVWFVRYIYCRLGVRENV